MIDKDWNEYMRVHNLLNSEDREEILNFSFSMVWRDKGNSIA